MPFSEETIARYMGIADDNDDKTEKAFVVDDADVRSACQIYFTNLAENVFERFCICRCVALASTLGARSSCATSAMGAGTENALASSRKPQSWRCPTFGHAPLAWPKGLDREQPAR